MKFPKQEKGEISDFQLNQGPQINFNLDNLADDSTNAEQESGHQYMLKIQQYRQCRICKIAEGSLISPCKCVGNKSYAHFDCLKSEIQIRISKRKLFQKLEKVCCVMCSHPFTYSYHRSTKLSLEKLRSEFNQSPVQVLIGLFSTVIFFLSCLICTGQLIRILSEQSEEWSSFNRTVIKLAVSILIPITGLVAIWFGYSFVHRHIIMYNRTVTQIKEYVL